MLHTGLYLKGYMLLTWCFKFQQGTEHLDNSELLYSTWLARHSQCEVLLVGVFQQGANHLFWEPSVVIQEMAITFKLMVRDPW